MTIIQYSDVISELTLLQRIVKPDVLVDLLFYRISDDDLVDCLHAVAFPTRELDD